MHPLPLCVLPLVLFAGLADRACCQAPSLDVVALPTRLEANVLGVHPGAAVLLVLGLQRTHIVLPGGLVLGVTPDVLGGLTLADADGEAYPVVALQRDVCAGLRLLVQAVALHPERPAAVTPVTKVRVPDRGERADLYVLFGQSNAEGHASVKELPRELRRPQLRGRVWSLTNRRFEGLAAGVNGRTLTTTDWCGPELTLSRSLAGAGDTIYLVKLAVDQSALGPAAGPLNEWGVDAGRLYSVLRDVIDEACEDLRGQGLAPRVQGIAMMQGESDATFLPWALGYQARLQQLVRQMRAELAAAQHADMEVPFVLGLIDARLPAEVFPFVAAVRTAQQAAVSALAACAAVETSGLPVQDDDTHLDTEGVMALGLQMGGALQRLRSRR